MLVLGAVCSFLEPFGGHLSPEIDKVSEELTLRYPHEGPWVEPAVWVVRGPARRARDRDHQPPEEDRTGFVGCVDFYWSPSESGGRWYTSREPRGAIRSSRRAAQPRSLRGDPPPLVQFRKTQVIRILHVGKTGGTSFEPSLILAPSLCILPAPA